jgi:hypothetical protein
MCIDMYCTGIKFVLISSVDMANAESILQKIYEACKCTLILQRRYTSGCSSPILPPLLAYLHLSDADAVMKNPFYTLEMPINATGFDIRMNAIVAAAGP